MIESIGHNLNDKAQRTTATRAGDVLLRERRGAIHSEHTSINSTEAVDKLDGLYAQEYGQPEDRTYTEFLYDPTINPRLIPAAQTFEAERFPRYRYDKHAKQFIDDDTVWTDIERRIVPLGQKTAAILGSAAVGFAGTELVTHSTLFDLAAIGAGSALGGMVNAVRDYRRLRTIYGELDKIQVLFSSEDHVIKLPNSSTAHYLTKQMLQELGDTNIPVSGTQAAMLQASDVLNWLSRNIAVDDVVRKHQPSRSERDSSPFRSKGATVSLNTSLWEMYYDSKTSRLDFGDDVAKFAKTFLKEGESLAQKLRLKLVPAEPKLDGEIIFAAEKGKLNKKFRNAWRDLNINFIQLPPGIVVSRLLRSAIDPTSLWQQIAPDLLTIQDNAIEQAAITEELKAIDRRAQHAGVTNHEDEVMTHGWQQRLNEVERSIFMTTLSVAGAAVLRDREHRYNSVREELMQTIGQTAYAQDQFGAMQLFDVGITALAQRLNPDSEEAISTARQLMNYLAGSVRHINGTESAYQQLYHGMQQKFPQLQLQ